MYELSFLRHTHTRSLHTQAIAYSSHTRDSSRPNDQTFVTIIYSPHANDHLLVTHKRSIIHHKQTNNTLDHFSFTHKRSFIRHTQAINYFLHACYQLFTIYKRSLICYIQTIIYSPHTGSITHHIQVITYSSHTLRRSLIRHKHYSSNDQLIRRSRASDLSHARNQSFPTSVN